MMKTKKLRIAAGIALLAAAVIIAVSASVGFYRSRQKPGSSEALPESVDYDTLLSSYYDALMKLDGRTLSGLVAPPAYWTYYMGAYDKTQEDIDASLTESAQGLVGTWTAQYGTDVKVTYRYSVLSEQAQDAIDEWNENMASMLGNDGAEMSRSVRLEVDLTLTGGKGTGKDVMHPTLGLIQGQWYMISEDETQ